MEDTTRIAELLSTAAVTTAETPPLHMCKCGRAPWRKGQRNCVFCNREANKKYRESLKAQFLPSRGGVGVTHPNLWKKYHSDR